MNDIWMNGGMGEETWRARRISCCAALRERAEEKSLLRCGLAHWRASLARCSLGARGTLLQRIVHIAACACASAAA
jgi:hypothetical protein